MKSAIFVPVGIPVYNHPDLYDKENHWRYTKPERQYETYVYQYKDEIEIEPNTYDYLVKAKGFKWELAYQFLNSIDYTQYEYIGFFDDDMITDIESINHGLDLARENNIKLFQLSVHPSSEYTHQIVGNDPSKILTVTNFNEGMGPFIHTSLIPTFLEFYKFHVCKSGYGLDLILSTILNEKSMIVHDRTMFHPPASFYGYIPSYYDRTEAEQEMNHILNDIFPKFMKHQYDIDTGPFQRQFMIYGYVDNPNHQPNYFIYRTS
jgi:hypothetical protein